MSGLTSREYAKAIAAGETARRAGNPRESNPHARDDTLNGRRRRDAWDAGWDRADGGKGRARRG